MIKLYELAAKNEDIRFSPYVWSVRLSLLHKGIEFERVPWHFIDKDAIASANSKTVPVINDDDIWMNESFDICLYLDEKYPDKPLITDPALARFFHRWIIHTALIGHFPMIAADVWDIITEEDQIYFRNSREKFLGKTLEEARAGREAATPAYLRSLAPMRDLLNRAAFLSGDAPGWNDFMAASVFIWARSVSDYDVIAEDEVLFAWRERMLDLFDGHARNAATAHNWG